MKLQRTTWILATTAILLGVGVYFYEIQDKPQREEIQEDRNKIFSFQIDDIQALTIKTKQQTLQFERTKEPNKIWQMKQPENVLANDAVMSFLLNLLVYGKSDRTFTISLGQRQDYGLENPSATIDIQLKNQQTHQLILGSPDFKNEFLYAQIDPPVQPDKEIKVSLVSKDLLTALEKKLEEWKQ
jgi:hypothetical protein